MATMLEQTLMRELRENKKDILEALEWNGCIKYIIELQEESGEVLITRFMTSEDIEKSVNKAISLLFPGSKSSEIKIFDTVLEFKIN